MIFGYTFFSVYLLLVFSPSVGKCSILPSILVTCMPEQRPYIEDPPCLASSQKASPMQMREDLAGQNRGLTWKIRLADPFPESESDASERGELNQYPSAGICTDEKKQRCALQVIYINTPLCRIVIGLVAQR
jgi:hypothetical protein